MKSLIWARVALALYCCAVVTAPPMPSYYGFAVNTVGFLVTGLATVNLIKDLNKHQKSPTNRIFLLYLSGSLLLLGRTYILSIPACWFNSTLSTFYRKHPILSISLFSTRPYSLLQVGLGCTLSAARLLLFVSPATFQNATNRPISMILSGSISILIVVLDYIFSAVHCNIYSKGFEVDKMVMSSILREELGIQNVDTNRTCLRTTDDKHQAEEGTESEVCKTFPSFAIIIIICLLLEFIKMVIAIKKEMLKLKRKNKVLNSSGNLHLQKKNLTRPKGKEDKAKKAVDIDKQTWQSCPSVFYVESPLKKPNLLTPQPVESIKHVRRLSIQCSPEKWAKCGVNTNPLNKVKNEKKEINVTKEYLNMLRFLYKRPGTILYVFGIITLPLAFLMIFSAQNPSCSFLTIEFNTILQRLYIYLTNPILLVL